MSDAQPRAVIDTPYLATTPENIERLLSGAGSPLDIACGLLANDPALLVHLIRRISTEEGRAVTRWNLRDLAGFWLESADFRWYIDILPASRSRMSDAQLMEHRRLCSRAAVGAGLIGEWSSDGLEALKKNADHAEICSIMAVLPSLIQLCGVSDRGVYPTMQAESTAWPREVGGYLGIELARMYRLPEEADHPSCVAVEIASAVSVEDHSSVLELKLPEWANRLSRPIDTVRQDIACVLDGLSLFEAAASTAAALTREQALQLVSTTSELNDEELDCESCRQNSYDNALATVRQRLGQPDLNLNEIVDHLMYALCNCGSLQRVNWYCINNDNDTLYSRRRKLAAKASSLKVGHLSLAEIPMLKILMERPRSIQVNPDVRRELQRLLPQEVADPFSQHYMCASVFCGSVPLGLLYADADGRQFGAAEVARFKSVARLATKLVTLLALRRHKAIELPDVSQLSYPSYALINAHEAANETTPISASSNEA